MRPFKRSAEFKKAATSWELAKLDQMEAVIGVKQAELSHLRAVRETLRYRISQRMMRRKERARKVSK